MVMDGPIPMSMVQAPIMTETHVLKLAQLLSPAYPIGAFAYSHGIEHAIHGELIKDGSDLENWLADLLKYGSLGNDCIFLHQAHSCEDASDLIQLNHLAMAYAASRERQLEMTLQGDAFCKTTAAVFGLKMRSLVYPVAVGDTAAQLNIDAGMAAALYTHAAISNLVSAAQRLMPLGQTEGQSILARLQNLCVETAQKAQGCTLDDIHSTTFLSDIASMRHETLQPRIFRT